MKFWGCEHGLLVLLRNLCAMLVRYSLWCLLLHVDSMRNEDKTNHNKNMHIVLQQGSINKYDAAIHNKYIALTSSSSCDVCIVLFVMCGEGMGC